MKLGIYRLLSGIYRLKFGIYRIFIGIYLIVIIGIPNIIQYIPIKTRCIGLLKSNRYIPDSNL